MLEDIKKGKISAVLAKDLSRFGRNNSEILYYVETYFPENNIRFVSLGEGIDSILQISPSLVSTRIRRVVKQLYERFEEEGQA